LIHVYFRIFFPRVPWLIALDLFEYRKQGCTDQHIA